MVDKTYDILNYSSTMMVWCVQMRSIWNWLHVASVDSMTPLTDRRCFHHHCHCGRRRRRRRHHRRRYLCRRRQQLSSSTSHRVFSCIQLLLLSFV